MTFPPARIGTAFALAAVLACPGAMLAGCSDAGQQGAGNGTALVDGGSANGYDGTMSDEVIPTRPETIHFRQGDERWKKIKYWDGNIWSDGCGLCAYAMIVDILNQADYDPISMLKKRGDWQGGEQFPEQTIGSKDGSTHEEWTLKTFGIQMSGVVVTLDEMKEKLHQGKTCYLVCSLGRVFHDKNGKYRNSHGHFVIVFKHDDDGFHVQDPAYERSLGCDVVYSDKQMRKMMKNAASITDYTKVAEVEPEPAEEEQSSSSSSQN